MHSQPKVLIILKRANAMVRQSARFGQMAHLQQPLVVKIRDTMLKTLPSQLLLRQVERVLKDEE